MTKQLEKVLQAIDGLNNDEINQVAERCNLRRTYLNKLNIRQFRIGDKVKFTPNNSWYCSKTWSKICDSERRQ